MNMYTFTKIQIETNTQGPENFTPRYRKTVMGRQEHKTY